MRLVNSTAVSTGNTMRSNTTGIPTDEFDELYTEQIALMVHEMDDEDFYGVPDLSEVAAAVEGVRRLRSRLMEFIVRP